MPWYPMAADAANRDPKQSTSPGGLIIKSSNLPEGDVPQGADLDTWQWDQYQLENDVAAKLGLTVGGRADASRKSRVLVAEFSRSKSIIRQEGQWRFGVAARLVVKVSNFSMDANMTLPFIAAEAQFNRLEASSALRVEGYVGATAAKQFPSFSTFDVETYVKLMDALSTLKDTIGGDVDNIRPVQLWAWAEASESPAVIDDRLTRAVGTMWALTRIAEGDNLAKAVGGYRDTDDEVAHDAIRETYGYLVTRGEDESPDSQARARARDLLDGYKAKSGWLR